MDDYWGESYGAGSFKAPGEKGDWPVVLGFDGGLGMPCAETLSEGGRVVAHSSNGGRFISFIGSRTVSSVTTFEGRSARDGNNPDELVPLLREVGFPLTPEGEHDESAPVVDGKAAVVALTERLTGIRVTKSFRQEATYELGLVPEQPAGEWTGLSSTSPMPTESICTSDAGSVDACCRQTANSQPLRTWRTSPASSTEADPPFFPGPQLPCRHPIGGHSGKASVTPREAQRGRRREHMRPESDRTGS